jgi:asparagine synthase (glutamine-hydrolysing)
MGDFLVDFRPADLRTVASLADQLRHLPHVQTRVLRTPAFDLALAITENPGLWDPYLRPDGSGGVAIAGRIALPDADLEAGRTEPGQGGLVCKALNARIARDGFATLENLSGNFAAIAWDIPSGQVRLVNDVTGVLPVFETDTPTPAVLGSHPDLVARANGIQSDLDPVSIAEFLLTGTVSPPFTYYARLRCIGRANVLAFQYSDGTTRLLDRRVYLPLEFQGRPDDREEDLAEELASAFRRAVALRSRRVLGRCAVALSGGLDSRAVLASLDPSADALAFTCYDSANLEFQSARSIANAVGIPFHPFRRDPEYYGSAASTGVRIGGGMGSFANNHFLGAIPWLRNLGAETLLTGCYCDYLFKALPLNRRTHPVTGLEELGPFDTEFYFSQVWPDTPLARQVQDRIAARFPDALRHDTSDPAVFALETLRTFPLCYEGDNAQRVVPQRVTGWFLPVSDPDLMRVYRRIPYRWKLNRSIFKHAVRSLCGTRFDRIPDANTGARVAAPWWNVALHSLLLGAKRRLRRLRPGLATDGSWPNWRYYTAHSQLLADLWNQPPGPLEPILRSALGASYPAVPFGQGDERQMWLQIQMLTLRLWAGPDA